MHVKLSIQEVHQAIKEHVERKLGVTVARDDSFQPKISFLTQYGEVEEVSVELQEKGEEYI